jgi:hypothetical protein
LKAVSGDLRFTDGWQDSKEAGLTALLKASAWLFAVHRFGGSLKSDLF